MDEDYAGVQLASLFGIAYPFAQPSTRALVLIVIIAE